MVARKYTKMFKILSFNGGGTLIIREMPEMQTVSVGIWTGIGSRYERVRQNGISHFVEHLLFKGTRRRNALEITCEVEGIGGYLNAFTSEESTCYYSRVTRGQIAHVSDVLQDMYLNSIFEKGEVERERGVILEELSMVQDQPSQKVMENLNRLLWPGHPLGAPIAGTVRTVESFRREDLFGYYRGNYTTGNTIVSIAGNIDEKQALKSFEKFFKRLPVGRKSIPLSFLKKPRADESYEYEQREVEQVNLVMGFRGVSRRHRLRFAVKLLNVILGENMSSRLFQVIREKNGLAYSIGSAHNFFAETGSFGIYAGLPPQKLRRALALICKELVKMKNKKVTASEISRAKDYSLGMMAMGMESTTEQMIWGGESFLAYGKVYHASDIARKLTDVTAEDIQAVANLLFRQVNCAVAGIGPKLGENFSLQDVIDLG